MSCILHLNRVILNEELRRYMLYQDHRPAQFRKIISQPRAAEGCRWWVFLYILVLRWCIYGEMSENLAPQKAEWRSGRFVTLTISSPPEQSTNSHQRAGLITRRTSDRNRA
jgi:hypothetical protein